jgi:signal transduction histidine kinase
MNSKAHLSSLFFFPFNLTSFLILFFIFHSFFSISSFLDYLYTKTIDNRDGASTPFFSSFQFTPFFLFLISSLFLLISFSNLDVSRKIEKTNQEKILKKPIRE